MITPSPDAVREALEKLDRYTKQLPADHVSHQWTRPAIDVMRAWLSFRAAGVTDEAISIAHKVVDSYNPHVEARPSHAMSDMAFLQCSARKEGAEAVLSALTAALASPPVSGATPIIHEAGSISHNVWSGLAACSRCGREWSIETPRPPCDDLGRGRKQRIFLDANSTARNLRRPPSRPGSQERERSWLSGS